MAVGERLGLLSEGGGGGRRRSKRGDRVERRLEIIDERWR
jgi:hypothetical protein